jgi:hypothetical protein
MAGSHNFGGRTPNKEPEKILIRSEGSLASAKFLELATHDELKKIRLAHQGRQPVTD